MTAQVRFSVREDVEVLVTEGLRKADQTELDALGVNPTSSLTRGYEQSGPCLTVLVDGIPAAMFGVAPHPRFPEAGVIWLLGTDRLTKASWQFLRECRSWIDFLQGSYEVLVNCVHLDNELHIKWLKWLGFTFLATRGPFIEFARLSHV